MTTGASTAASQGRVRCRTHHQPAGWQCTGCGLPLCPDCVGIQKRGHVELTVCLSCRELARLLTVHRGELLSYPARLPGTLLWPARGDRLISLVMVTLVVAVLSFFSGVGNVVATLALYGTSYAIVRTTALGSDAFALDAGAAHEIRWPAIKAALVYLLLGAIGALYVIYLRAPGNLRGLWFDPVLWGLALTAFVWGPMATLMAATHTPLLRMLNPALVAIYIGRLGSDYWVALIAVALVTLLSGVLGLVGRAAALLPVPFLPTLIASAIETYAVFVSSRMLGLLLHVRGDRLDYGVPADFQVPVLPGAVPRGQVPELPATPLRPAANPARPGEPEAPPVDKFAPIELADEPAPAHLVAAPPEARRAAPEALDASALPSANDFFSKSVHEAVARGEWALAFDAWKASPEPERLGLNADQLLGLGRTAASLGDNGAARALLTQAAAGSTGEVQARAKVFLARLLHERFADAEAAQKLYREVVAAAPDSEPGTFARKMLGP